MIKRDVTYNYKHATGVQEFEYGNMGEMIRNRHTYTIPGSEIFTLTTEWEYDSWNRIKSIIYPDGEVLDYHYNLGGLLESVESMKDGVHKPYITSISYDEYEQRIQQEYGNGVISTYNYDNMRRLILVSTSSINVGNHLQEITYNYDQVSNIASIINDAMDPFTHEYSYDSDNRLLSALSSGTFDGDYITNDYKVTYSPSGKITNKTFSVVRDLYSRTILL